MFIGHVGGSIVPSDDFVGRYVCVGRCRLPIFDVGRCLWKSVVSDLDGHCSRHDEQKTVVLGTFSVIRIVMVLAFRLAILKFHTFASSGGDLSHNILGLEGTRR